MKVTPEVAVVIPAHNEEKSLPTTLRGLYNQRNISAFEHSEEPTMPGGNGRPSKRQASRTHHDGTGQSIADAVFGPGPRSTSHGGSRKNRKKKGKGSR